jgi:hypothetical protein
MRRFAILVMTLGACCFSAVAGAQQRPSNRLQKYDVAGGAPQFRRGGVTAARHQAAPHARYQSARHAHYQEAEPVYYQEEMAPGPMTQAPAGDPFVDEPAGTPPYEQYETGYFDDYSGDSCGSCGECYDSCCCGPTPGFWGRAEYLYWWVRGGDTPPLVTTSPDNTPQAQAGVLPDATVLFGNQRINTQGRSGARFTLGYWFNCCEYTGVDTSWFFLGNVREQFHASSGGSPILARPFFNVDTESQDAQLIAFPDVVVGAVNVYTNSRVYGGDVNLRRALHVDCWKRFDVIAGYRYFRLAEDLTISSNTTSIDEQGGVPVGTTFAIFDSFDTRNNFNGGQLGINTQLTNGCWTLDLLAKLALGAVSQTVTINGQTVTTVPDSDPITATGGILALDSNIGTYHRNQFSVMPEFGVDLRYQWTPLWRVNLGYSLLIVTNVVRPGDQIDLNVDPNLFPPSLGGSQPTFAFQDSDVWLQGINVGIECNF